MSTAGWLLGVGMLVMGKGATVNIGHQGPLFGELEAAAKPVDPSSQQLSVLITVKAAPNPSVQYGERRFPLRYP